MIKVFPFYKGENIANNPLGYTTKANARKRMQNYKVIPDFEKTLPEDYWFQYLYTYQNGTKNSDFHLFRRTLKIIEYDLTKQIYIKDIKDENVVRLFMKLESEHYTRKWYEKTEEDWDKIENISLEINRMGYYPYCWKNDKDYWKRYTKFVTNNVEFKEMDVDILKTEV